MSMPLLFYAFLAWSAKFLLWQSMRYQNSLECWVCGLLL